MSTLGKSILDILWEELDSIVDRIMEDGEPEVEGFTPDHALSLGREWGEERGKAQGVAYAIALLTDPLAPSVPEVRAEAMRRYDGRLLDSVVDPPPVPARSTRHLRVVRTVRRRRNQGK